MKLVFLDIDGVLNSRRWYERRPVEGRNMLGEIDPEAACRVQRLCYETDAKIVISSTWRLIHRMTDLRQVFREKGLYAPVIGKTPTIPTKDRGDEIQAWLDSEEALEEPTGMVILDDDSDMAHLRPWLVKTSFADGFTNGDIHRAKLTLERAMPPSSEEKP